MKQYLWLMRLPFIAVLMLNLAMLLHAPALLAAELLMFERAGCVYCARWNHDIAPAYITSREGKIAPLRRVDLAKGQPTDVKLVAPVRFTPTFVLVDNKREVQRITGYVDNAMFWGMLVKMLKRLPDFKTSPGIR